MWKKRRYSVPLHPRTTAVIRSKLHGKAFIIKRPKYKRLNTKENAIVSVDVNRSNYNIDPRYFNSFPVLFCNTKCLNTLFSSSTSKTLWSRIEM